MSDNLSQNLAMRVYRVDRFEVPTQARDEFIERVQETHHLLRTMPGFIQDFLLEQASGDAIVKIITIVEWENSEAVDNGREAVKAYREKTQFNPQDLMTRLGIKAELANYSHIEA